MSISSCAILVCSDRCFNGEAEDRSGKALEKIVREELECQNTILKIVPGTCSLENLRKVAVAERNINSNCRSLGGDTCQGAKTF